MIRNCIFSFILISVFISCSSDSNDDQETYTPVEISLDIPKLFSDKLIAPVIPSTNPTTQEGVALGKKLFFDTILSNDNSISCASCHDPAKSFTDNLQFSEGVNNSLGTRNSMPLFNLAWNFDERFAWDGKEFGLESQAFEPVTNHLEMNSDWKEVANKLKNHFEYPTLFKQAFGDVEIDSTLVVKALAQFERTLISGNSKFDRFLNNEVQLTPEEQNGFNVFMEESKGDCFHCHGSENNPLWTDNQFHNNGLDETFTDLGLGAISGDPNDNGKFRTPSLRNLAFTAPYMHDGRFATLDEVIDHYSEGLKNSATIDPLMKKVAQGGVGLTDQDKADLKAFLLTLTDTEFVNNPNFQK
ncbi:cytochrome c peroxidase [uncultured Tenacibaculum sp.]|uniref:cytochrome-c peroxidase n=1 Tax=uncultured Tenacibaculum sp. TaxID=174713 RepID=UPI00262D9F7B|nr:cytochrome c peroxidase [uncultured Tenacibaculum sp.]